MRTWSRRAAAATLSAAGILMVTMGARQSLGLFVSPLNSATGLGITAISLALAIAKLMWGVLQPVAGALADRFGSARVLAAGLVLLLHAARRGDPVRPAAGHAPAADELEAWARHAHAANGFGDAILLANPTSRRSSMAVPQSITQPHVDSTRYAKCIEASRRIRWDIDRDVIRNREFDFTKKFLSDGLSYVDRLHFLGADERRLLSQIQGRSYANIFGLVERYIAAKVLEVSRDHWLATRPRWRRWFASPTRN